MVHLSSELMSDNKLSIECQFKTFCHREKLCEMFNLKFLFLFSLAVWQVNSLQGGTNAVLGQFPSFITVFVPAPTTICGGAILNANHVLTLAMCMLNANLLLHPANQVSFVTLR